MESFDKLSVNSKNTIKVNKRQNSKNKELKYLKNDIPTLNEEYSKNNIIKKVIFVNNNKNQHNDYYFQNSPKHKNYDEMTYSFNRNHKELNYRKINIINRIYKNDNKQNNNNKTQLSTFLNGNLNNKKMVIEEDNGNKLLICKSETQYPLTYRKDNKRKNGCSSMKNINYNPNKKYINLRYCSISPKYGINFRKENEELNKYKIDIYSDNEIVNNNIDYNFDNNNILEKKDYNNYPLDTIPNMAFNNYGHFYQPIREQINNNTNYYYNNNENIYVNNVSAQDFIDFPQKIPNNNHILNKTNYIEKNEYIKIFKRNDIYNLKKNMNNIDFDINEAKKDKELINIYKKKLINIFVKFMTDFYFNYSKKIYEELISKLRKIKEGVIISNNKYQEKNNNIENEYNKNLYIKKNNYKINNNINNNFQNYNSNTIKSFSSHKKFSSISIYKRTNKYKYINNENMNENIHKTKMLSDIYDKENEGILKKSESNLFIPKNRNVNNYKKNNVEGSGSVSKGSIFNDIKINKNLKFLEMGNKYYRTNNNNIYKNKNELFNCKLSLGNQKTNLMLLKNIKSSKNLFKKVKQENNINKKVNPIVYKKIMSKNKYKDYKNNKINNYIKKTERINSKNNKYKDKIYINNRYPTYDAMKNNYKSSIFNHKTNNNKSEEMLNMNINLNNSRNLSNDINDYYLDDKPMKMVCFKNSNFDFEDDSQINSGRGDHTSRIFVKTKKHIFKKSKEDNLFDIKNIIKIITEDKRLFINFNYININNKKYNKRHNETNYNNFVLSKINSIYIKPEKTKKYIINRASNENLINLNEKPEKISTNLNKIIQKRKIKSGILKLEFIINNNIYKTKSKFIKCLKKLKIYSILIKIILNIYNKKLKKYFIQFKKYTIIKPIKKKLHVSFKEIKPIVGDYNNKDKMINPKIKFDFIIDPKKNEFNFINPKKINKLQGKEKLKFLVKQMYKNNNKDKKSYTDRSYSDEDKDLKNKNTSFKDDKKTQTNFEIPLWKSIGILNKKNTYIKKNIAKKYK